MVNKKTRETDKKIVSGKGSFGSVGDIFLIPDGTCSIFWKILILENYRIFEFLILEN